VTIDEALDAIMRYEVPADTYTAIVHVGMFLSPGGFPQIQPTERELGTVTWVHRENGWRVKWSAAYAETWRDNMRKRALDRATTKLRGRT
jgi:hypothetical protein